MMSKKQYEKLKKKYKNLAKGKKKKKKKKDKYKDDYKQYDFSELRYPDLPMYFKDGDITVINKVNLTAHDSFLLSTYPNEYSTESPKMYKAENIKRRDDFLKRLAEKEKEKEFREAFKIMKEYEKYEKNPKKYAKNGGMTKQEKQIMKYFNKIKSKKKSKRNSLNDISLEMDKTKDISSLMLLIEEYDKNQLIDEIASRKYDYVYGKKKGKKKRNPNYLFSHNKTKDVDDRDMMLINALDEEINRRLCSDNIFAPNNIATEYDKYKYKKKKKKKKKKMSIDDIII